MDGPGPGSYVLPGAIKVKKNDHKRALSTQDCTFGKGKREWSDIPQDVPSPTSYNPPLIGDPFVNMYSHKQKGNLFSKADSRNLHQLDLHQEEGHNGNPKPSIGPQTYNPNINAMLKTGTSKKMLGRSFLPEQRIDPDNPGPGHYALPDPFILKEPRKRCSPSESRKKQDLTTKMPREEIEKLNAQATHNEAKMRKGFAHFGTSTREGVKLGQFDETDDGIRISHVPKLKGEA